MKILAGDASVLFAPELIIRMALQLVPFCASRTSAARWSCLSGSGGVIDGASLWLSIGVFRRFCS